ncbi:hypothetical protein N2W54_002039 [Lotmaria passim]
MSVTEFNLPHQTTERTANVRFVDPLGWWDPWVSWLQSHLGPTADKTLQKALNELISIGVPIAAQTMINSMSYKLGNSQLPVETTFAKSSGWAVALIVVLTVVCALVVVLVGMCIWWERRLERRLEQRKQKKRAERKVAEREDRGNDERRQGAAPVQTASCKSAHGFEEFESRESSEDTSSTDDTDSYSSDSSDSSDWELAV